MNKFVFVSIIAATAMLSACASKQTPEEYEQQCLEPKPGTIESVNTMCVVVPTHPVDPGTKCSEFNGKKIGFCCAGCIGKWEAMNAEQKQAALDKAMAAAKK
ncbi:MAG: hypothetical protein ACK54H_03025 [Phycisphaerales bacterium]|jgi:hypothetical protein